MSKITPITPAKALKLESTFIPDEVISCFNELIVKNLRYGKSVITQDEAINLICSKTEFSKDQLFDKHYLDIEPLFRKAGWKVEYDRPGYNESYNASWCFSK